MPRFLNVAFLVTPDFAEIVLSPHFYPLHRPTTPLQPLTSIDTDVCRCELHLLLRHFFVSSEAGTFPEVQDKATVADNIQLPDPWLDQQPLLDLAHHHSRQCLLYPHLLLDH
jgi:hypothetical protein